MSTIHVIAVAKEKGGVDWDHALTEQELDAFLDHCVLAIPEDSAFQSPNEHPLTRYLRDRGFELPSDDANEIIIRIMNPVVVDLPSDRFDFNGPAQQGVYFYYPWYEFTVELTGKGKHRDYTQGARFPMGEGPG